MKKLIMFIGLFACIACTQTNKINNGPHVSTEYNEQQAGFIEFMQALSQEHHNRPNDLDLGRFDKKMIDYLDSIQPIIGWKGTVSNISIINPHELIYHINFKFGEFDCTFASSLMYETEKELNDDHIYNRLLNTPNGSTVYFDGYIEGAFEGTFARVLDIAPTDSLKYLQPLYTFNTFEIYTTQPEPLSPLVIKQLSLYIQEYTLFWKKAWEIITDTEYSKALAALPKIEKESLTEDEKEYLNRSRKYLMPLLFK